MTEWTLEHPWLTFFLAILALSSLESVAGLVAAALRRGRG